MDHEENMKVFVQVAQQASFAAAARKLRISTASASKRVAALEARVGARLFDRTTRRVGLTEAGRVYLERCIECLHALEDADASVGELTKTPKGSLRMTAPIDFGEHLMPVLADIMNAHPNLLVDVRLTNRVVDMVEEGIDVGVRVAGSLDGHFVARPLARTQLALFAAPAYLAKHGRPERPEDLERHKNIVFTEPKPRDELVFTRNGRQVRVKVHPTLTANHAAALQIAVQRGVVRTSNAKPVVSTTVHKPTEIMSATTARLASRATTAPPLIDSDSPGGTSRCENRFPGRPNSSPV